MYADALLPWGKGKATNTSFLDPPFLFNRSGWSRNRTTTLCFRHSGAANVCFADGHVEPISSSAGTIVSPGSQTGYIGENNAPHYVPDWEEW